MKYYIILSAALAISAVNASAQTKRSTKILERQAAVPLFAAVMVGVSFLMSMSICLLLVLVACGVYAFVRVGTVQDAMDRLLEDGDFTRGHKAVKGRLTALTAAYWLVVVAIFLWYTFGPNGNGQPQYSWFIWAIAGVVYAACVVAAKAFVRKKV